MKKNIDEGKPDDFASLEELEKDERQRRIFQTETRQLLDRAASDGEKLKSYVKLWEDENLPDFAAYYLFVLGASEIAKKMQMGAGMESPEVDPSLIGGVMLSHDVPQDFFEAYGDGQEAKNAATSMEVFQMGEAWCTSAWQGVSGNELN